MQKPILLLADQHPLRPADIRQCPGDSVCEFEQPVNETREEWPFHGIDDLGTRLEGRLPVLLDKFSLRCSDGLEEASEVVRVRQGVVEMLE